jgi:hypothetical protein
MLFVLALCPTTPLRRTFPEVPFLSLLGRTALLMWFSRITEMCYHDATGGPHCMSGSSAGLYQELNVVAFLQERALFVPGIYATSMLSIRVGHRYGMPKQPTTMQVQVDEKWFCSEVRDGTRQSFARARRLGSGKGAAKLAPRFLPSFTWPVRFPSGSSIRALIEETPRVQLAYIQAGQLALEAEWLPKAVRLLPVGCYLPSLRMQLPPLEEQTLEHPTARRTRGASGPQCHRGRLPARGESPLPLRRTTLIISAGLMLGRVMIWWLKKRQSR